MSQKLSIYQVRNSDSRCAADFNKWSEITHGYTSHSLKPSLFDKNSKIQYRFCFSVKWMPFPVYVVSNCFLSARLKFWTAVKGKKQIKNLSFFHDRLVSSVVVLAADSASVIGLSNVSILQQKI